MRHMSFLRPTAVALGLALAAGGASAQTLTMGVRGGPESLDPHYAALGPHACNVFQRRLAPCLATALAVTSDSKTMRLVTNLLNQMQSR